MQKLEFILLRREDLKDCYKDESLKDINWTDFSYVDRDTKMSINSTRLFAMANLVMFVDENGETIIFKNRYGFVGLCK